MGYHYGKIIRMYRLQRGLSQSELAECWPRADGEKGVNTRYVQDVEYGRKRIVDATILRSLATLLDIPLWQFGLSEYDPFNPTAWQAFNLLQEQPGSHKEGLAKQQDKSDLRHIPPAYYERMLHTYTQVESTLFSWTMWNLGLLQLHSQLNYVRQNDVHIAVFKCSPPNPLVRSMYEIAHYNFHHSSAGKLRFFGRESLAGKTLQESKTLINENSCAAPIMRCKRVGACLIVQSPIAIISSDVEIIQRYADLFSLALFDHEFYAPQRFNLCTIPPDIQQDALLQEFDLQRFDLTSLNKTDPGRILQAEQLVLQRISLARPGDVDVSTR